MKAFKHIYILLVIILLILGFLFYWFQWRPAEIRKKCVRAANITARKTTVFSIYGNPNAPFQQQSDWLYTQCCREKGIIP